MTTLNVDQITDGSVRVYVDIDGLYFTVLVDKHGLAIDKEDFRDSNFPALEQVLALDWEQYS